MNQICIYKGSARYSGTIAYISQSAFLINDSLRENILFGSEYDEQKYFTVLKLCQLEEDLRALHLGDMTQIGERGANLSGGQKQRISIARAVYSDSDIYLIDDTLSALDFEVGKKIMEDVFRGYLK